MNGSLLNALQNKSTTWDWQGGEAAPSAIRTPWLAGAWHYDEFGRIVPNDPNNPSAPWNLGQPTEGRMTMEEYYDYMGKLHPESMFAIKTTPATAPSSLQNALQTVQQPTMPTPPILQPMQQPQVVQQPVTQFSGVPSPTKPTLPVTAWGGQPSLVQPSLNVQPMSSATQQFVQTPSVPFAPQGAARLPAVQPARPTARSPWGGISAGGYRPQMGAYTPRRNPLEERLRRLRGGM